MSNKRRKCLTNPNYDSIMKCYNEAKYCITQGIIDTFCGQQVSNLSIDTDT